MMDKINKLPVIFQLILIITLLYCTWHFRFYTTGVDQSELTKIEGVLHSFRCLENMKGADTIILNTSLLEEEISFEGWQKCRFLADVIDYANTSQKVVFYTKLHKGILNPDGELWVYAIDLKSTGDKLIYPKNGLGIRHSPNFLVLILVFIALSSLKNVIGELQKKRLAKVKDRE